MTIEPFIGLKFLAEVTGGRNRLLNIIEKEVKPKRNERIPHFGMIAAQVEGKKGGRLDSGEKTMLTEQVSEYYKRKSANFFKSFETLNYLLNTVEENKFVYFFSEGLSNAMMATLRGGGTLYRTYLKRVSQHLGRCGAVLFVINPTGVDHSAEPGKIQADLSPASGENSMVFLAQETGGKYLEGTPEKISQRIENMHRAYYEIAFPDIPGMKGTRKITVKSIRKGVVIHSLCSLEKRKTYAQMNNVEKELMALNLIQPYALVTPAVTSRDVKIHKIIKSKNKVVYVIRVPRNFWRKTLDIFKFQLTGGEDNPQVTKIEKESIRISQNTLKIEFRLIKGENKDNDQLVETYFTLVNGEDNAALVCGTPSHLDYLYPLPTKMSEFEKVREKTGKGYPTISSEEMEKILVGVADYCERLKQSAFHFICDEKIVETMTPLSPPLDVVPDITTRTQYEARNLALWQIRSRVCSQVNKYQFSYRLIKNKDKIIEKREIIKIKDKNPENINVSIKTYGDAEGVVNPTRFFSQKVIFAPVTLFDIERQGLYDYRFITYEVRNDRTEAVIEVIPRDPSTPFVYGIAWINLEDYSVTLIEANPRSIQGYELLQALAKRLKTKLYLSLETEFDHIHNGIRFPTRVSIREKYRGGQIVGRSSRSKNWERNHTEFIYSNYQFFEVKVDVVEEKMK